MANGSNGTPAPPDNGTLILIGVIALTALGIVAGIVYAVLTAVPDLLLIGAILAPSAAVVTALLALIKGQQDTRAAAAVAAVQSAAAAATALAAVHKVEELKVTVDGRLSQLLDTTASARYAEGQLAGPGPPLVAPTMALPPPAPAPALAAGTEFTLTAQGVGTVTAPPPLPPEGDPE